MKSKEDIKNSILVNDEEKTFYVSDEIILDMLANVFEKKLEAIDIGDMVLQDEKLYLVDRHDFRYAIFCLYELVGEGYTGYNYNRFGYPDPLAVCLSFPEEFMVRNNVECSNVGENCLSSDGNISRTIYFNEHCCNAQSEPFGGVNFI